MEFRCLFNKNNYVQDISGGDEWMLRQLTYNHLFFYLYVYYYQYVGGKRRW